MSLLKPRRYIRKPFEVEAVEVTAENMSEVAEWCGGEILEGERKEKVPVSKNYKGKRPFKFQVRVEKFVRVDVKNPINERQSQAFAGDWVLASGEDNFKVYNAKAFKASFDPMDEVEVDEDVPAVSDVSEGQDVLDFDIPEVTHVNFSSSNR